MKCEAREPGKKPHEFETPDHDTARAMCDAHGWELIRVYQPGADADRPASRPAKGDPMLSKVQVRALAIEAGKAFRILDHADLTGGLSEDAWRREEVRKSVGRKGLSSCQNSHYKRLRNHFRRLQGHKTAAGDDQGAPQSGEGGDTLERRTHLVRTIATELDAHARRVSHPQDEASWVASTAAMKNGGAIGRGYLLGIARAKNPETELKDLDALVLLTVAKLEHLLWTMRNRIAVREGHESKRGRNKSQRKPKP